MTWHLEGTYFENCNCEMVCRCLTSGLTVAGDQDRCQVALAFHIDTGESDGVDLSGLNLCMIADAPALMSEGNWKAAVVVDEKADEAQANALAAIFGGQVGGPLGDLAPLIGEMVGSSSAPFEYVNDGFTHSVKVGEMVDMTAQDFVSPLDGTGKGIRVSGAGFPADTLAAGTATKSKVDAFGLTWDNTGKNTFSAAFAWSA